MHADAAHRLLADEGADASTAAEWAGAAERVYRKIFQRLAPIVGAVAVQALFGRSVKLCSAEFPCLLAVPSQTSPAYGDAQALVDCLSNVEPSLSRAAAERICARFLELISALIGERLVSQVLLTTFVRSDTEADDDQESS